MDLLSTIRKTGSRGGVNFSWDEVANSSHRENYLGHSLKAPVGRWAKGRDLNWYAKSDATPADSAETDEERKAREHKEELRRIKEAEEDAMARALGLPPPVRTSSGANAVDVEPKRQVGPASGPPRDAGRDESRSERSRRHGDDRRERRRHRDRSKSRSRSGAVVIGRKDEMTATGSIDTVEIAIGVEAEIGETTGGVMEKAIGTTKGDTEIGAGSDIARGRESTADEALGQARAEMIRL
ncbi:hypothetical protein M440DRAFT_1461808 [Trichoderma longibrachiatum ATCC 18648]|uniref:Multiple myeloma tumor-associated protein 2-like N-terminal domain-containing protein n=1 Tax=Trichoderma longibrachiatum ATCC 18648 TaxID=983965 RepID=A0A2T4CB29_TRILO|nr:hypothetical protein M440DRAFT_1461808 [Trichoderma longibrachiatum ATCC 18648]